MSKENKAVPADSVPQTEPHEGKGRHSGRNHPPTEKVVDAKEDHSAQQRAYSQRKASTGQDK
jgi:hypothetical protein